MSKQKHGRIKRQKNILELQRRAHHKPRRPRREDRDEVMQPLPNAQGGRAER